jgi:uncharacterized protein (TIGR04141 family)
MFAFPFGPTGRFLLRSDVYERGYGLRAALNLLYPRGSSSSGRLRAVDSKRRSSTILRSRIQVSEPSDFDIFDVNRLRDTVQRADGIPADQAAWGRRIGGSDALSMSLDIEFAQIGRLCRQIERVHAQDDYTDSFDWIDYIRPVSDPHRVAELDEMVLQRLIEQDLTNLSLAPPEIIDWQLASGFRFHFDRPQGVARAYVVHPDLRLSDYLRGLVQSGQQLDALSIEFLRNHNVYAVDDNGTTVHKWSVWRCLVGELEHDGSTIVLDEGDFFDVRQDYVRELDAFIDGIPNSTADLPQTTPDTEEKDYNADAARMSDDLLLLDRQLIRVQGHTTPIEVCDLLSRSGHLIHVKRHLGSSNLSHLFSQGMVSAELLQSNPEFRSSVRAKIAEVAGLGSSFDLIAETGFDSSSFEVVYAVAETWAGRTAAEALPFFSRVNLREFASALRTRGFGVAFDRIEAVRTL